MKNNSSLSLIASRVLLAMITVITLSCVATSPAGAQFATALPPPSATIDPDPIFGEVYILINKDQQKLYVLENEKVLLQSPCATSKEHGENTVSAKDRSTAWMTFTVEVSDAVRLGPVLAQIARVAGVRHARRK